MSFIVLERTGQNQFKETENKGWVNLSQVVEALPYDTGKLVLIMNDWHEHTFEQPKMSNKGHVIGTQRSKQMICSEIFLSEEDSKKFIKLTEITE